MADSDVELIAPDVPRDLDGVMEWYGAYSDEIAERFKLRDWKVSIRCIVAQAVIRDRENWLPAIERLRSERDAAATAEREACAAVVETVASMMRDEGAGAVWSKSVLRRFDDLLKAISTAVRARTTP